MTTSISTLEFRAVCAYLNGAELRDARVVRVRHRIVVYKSSQSRVASAIQDNVRDQQRARTGHGDRCELIRLTHFGASAHTLPRALLPRLQRRAPHGAAVHAARERHGVIRAVLPMHGKILRVVSIPSAREWRDVPFQIRLGQSTSRYAHPLCARRTPRAARRRSEC